MSVLQNSPNCVESICLIQSAFGKKTIHDLPFCDKTSFKKISGDTVVKRRDLFFRVMTSTAFESVVSRMFEKIDIDQSGSITRAEMDAVFSSFDSDGQCPFRSFQYYLARASEVQKVAWHPASSHSSCREDLLAIIAGSSIPWVIRFWGLSTQFLPLRYTPISWTTLRFWPSSYNYTKSWIEWFFRVKFISFISVANCELEVI